MITGTSKAGAAGVAVNEAVNARSTPFNTSGGDGGMLSREKDATESAAQKNGEIYKQFQAKFGEKPAKAREIKKTLGKDDFLRIMLTQMKNQDPTNPFKAEQMATEIAQFTSVEQLQNVNQNLNKMATQNKPLEQMSMTNLIGKTVTIDRERFPHLDGQPDDLSFKIPKDAANVEVTIESEMGEEVFKKDLGPQKSGEVKFVWDGVKTNTLAAKAGNYRIRVNAKDESGSHIQINPQSQAKVIGVSFEGAEPVFLVGDARHQDKVTMRNISRIELDIDLPSTGPKSPSQDISQAQPRSAMPMSFRELKDPIKPMELRSTLNPMSAPNPTINTAANTVKPFMGEKVDFERGFPNGLREGVSDGALVGNQAGSLSESQDIDSGSLGSGNSVKGGLFQ